MAAIAPDAGETAWVELTRGGMVESVHRVHVAVADGRGRLLAAAGDPHRVAFMRSAAKPLQALALVASGAAGRFNLDAADLAIACASHVGAAIHQDAVGALLRRAALDAGALRCGAHAPVDTAAYEDLLRRGAAPERIHNNCSGKHAGMLVTCVHQGWPTEGYLSPDHPLQRWIADIVATMCGAVPRLAPDGCGVPSFAVPLHAMAAAYAGLGGGPHVPPGLAEAAARLTAAMAARPELVSGPGRVNTVMLACMGDQVATKGGAEGVWCAGLRAGGVGIAVKVEDGGDRAAAAAALAVARACGFPGAGDPRLDPFAAPVLRNTLGDAVGEMRVRLPLGFSCQGPAAGPTAVRVE